MIPVAHYDTFKRYNIILIVGASLFVFGFILLVFCRPYIYDSSEYDLFFVFSLVAMFPGGGIMFLSAYLQCKLWRGIYNGDILVNVEPTVQPTLDPYQQEWIVEQQQYSDIGFPNRSYQHSATSLQHPYGQQPGQPNNYPPQRPFSPPVSNQYPSLKSHASGNYPPSGRAMPPGSRLPLQAVHQSRFDTMI